MIQKSKNIDKKTKKSIDKSKEIGYTYPCPEKKGHGQWKLNRERQ